MLAAQEPLWPPGTQHGYHALTYGHVVGELVRRISGRSLGTFFRDEVARPLGLDFWIGMPAEHDARVAPIMPVQPRAAQDEVSEFFARAMSDPTSIPALVALNSGGLLFPGAVDRREVYGAEIPAANGIANARALAAMYRPLALGGSVDGVDLLDEETLVEATRVASASSVDATLGIPTRFALGFMKAMDNRSLPGNDSVLIAEEAFGHAGYGGSVGFADPPARMSFGYSMNRQGQGLGINERGHALIDAVYRTLGYTRPERGGIWRRP